MSHGEYELREAAVPPSEARWNFLMSVAPSELRESAVPPSEARWNFLMSVARLNLENQPFHRAKRGGTSLSYPLASQPLTLFKYLLLTLLPDFPSRQFKWFLGIIWQRATTCLNTPDLRILSVLERFIVSSQKSTPVWPSNRRFSRTYCVAGV